MWAEIRRHDGVPVIWACPHDTITICYFVNSSLYCNLCIFFSVTLICEQMRVQKRFDFVDESKSARVKIPKDRCDSLARHFAEESLLSDP